MKENFFYEGLIIFIILAFYFINRGNSFNLKENLNYFLMFLASSSLLQIYVSKRKFNYPLIIFGMVQVYCVLILLRFNFSNFIAHASFFTLALSYGLLKLYILKRRNDYILPFIFILIMIPLFIFLLPHYKALYFYK